MITVTLNPAFDLHYEMERFTAHRENYADSVHRQAGGKGINVSRVLQICGIKNKAYVILGRENAESFAAYLKKSRMDFEAVYTEGAIRENITFHPKNSPETRVSLDHFTVCPDVFRQLEDMVLRDLMPGTIAAVSGRFPKGIDKRAAVEFLLRLKDRGALLALDSNSLTLSDLLRIKPWFIKPNEWEIRDLGFSIDSTSDARGAARAIYGKGIANVLVTLGEKGAVFAGGGLDCAVSVPRITPLSTIGAGDSAVAGFIGAFSLGKSLEQCVRTAAAYGCAACLTKGTLPPLPRDAAWVMERVAIER